MCQENCGRKWFHNWCYFEPISHSSNEPIDLGQGWPDCKKFYPAIYFWAHWWISFLIFPKIGLNSFNLHMCTWGGQLGRKKNECRVTHYAPFPGHIFLDSFFNFLLLQISHHSFFPSMHFQMSPYTNENIVPKIVTLFGGQRLWMCHHYRGANWGIGFLPRHPRLLRQ